MYIYVCVCEPTLLSNAYKKHVPLTLKLEFPPVLKIRRKTKKHQKQCNH